MIGQVIGALTTTATRTSVIFSADGSEARRTFDWTSEAAAAACASTDSSGTAAAAPAATPTNLKKPRRSTYCRAARFIALLPALRSATARPAGHPPDAGATTTR